MRRHLYLLNQSYVEIMIGHFYAVLYTFISNIMLTWRVTSTHALKSPRVILESCRERLIPLSVIIEASTYILRQPGLLASRCGINAVINPLLRARREKGEKLGVFHCRDNEIERIIPNGSIDVREDKLLIPAASRLQPFKRAAIRLVGTQLRLT